MASWFPCQASGCYMHHSLYLPNRSLAHWTSERFFLSNYVMLLRKRAKSLLVSHQHHRLLTPSQLLIQSQSVRTTVKSWLTFYKPRADPLKGSWKTVELLKGFSFLPPDLQQCFYNFLVHSLVQVNPIRGQLKTVIHAFSNKTL